MNEDKRVKDMMEWVKEENSINLWKTWEWRIFLCWGEDIHG